MAAKKAKKKHSPAAEAALADARYVLARATAHLKDFDRALKHLKKKPVDKPFLATFKQTIRDASTEMTEQAVAKNLGKKTTSVEESRRASLHDALLKVRDDVVFVTDDVVTRRAFGHGRRINPRSTAALVAAAADVELAAKKPEFADVAKHASLTPARIAQLTKLRRDLTGADTAQGEQRKITVGVTATKKQKLGTVKKMTAHVRSVASRIFRKEKALLAQFLRTSTPAKKRAKKKTPAAPTTPSTPS